MVAQRFDCIVIGAGIVGLTVAYELVKRQPSINIAVLEKESALGFHASGRNSGVMHCGIFYGAESMKAQLCAKGAAQMVEFAREHNIPLSMLGKVIVATEEHQLPAIERLLGNARNNGIPVSLITDAELREIEPYAAPAIAAIHCPTTAVIDSKAVLAILHERLKTSGVTFLFNCEVQANPSPQLLHTTQGDIAFGYAYNCAGAYADRVAKYFGQAQDYALIPFKGIYWKLSEQANHKVRGNIYPVPDPNLPFLGVHLTRVINNDVYLGPTAIPALGRENYQGLKGIKPLEALQVLAMLSGMYCRNQQNFRLLTHTEIAKYHKKTFYRAARSLMPSLAMEDMVPTHKAGIRPQLVNIASKRLEMDYILEQTEYSLHVLNAISPAFTSSFAFAEVIVSRSRLH